MSKVISKVQSKFLVPMILFLGMYSQYLKNAWIMNGQLGGYVHDTAMSQWIPPTSNHNVVGTWTMTAGSVAGTISAHKAAAAETTVVSIPVCIPSNSVAGKGAYLKSIEVDYEITTLAVTSITPVVNLVARGIDGAVAVVTAQANTYLPIQATAIAVGKHKLVVTITSPFWLLNTQYAILQLTIVCAATSVLDIFGAVANFTKRM